ncbi:MAG TPA: hypothetical protein VGQ16_05740 [Vicinamibacterales bacterium]|nr:hypothetical protein [Vicinamibacterales bacterium]
MSAKFGGVHWGAAGVNAAMSSPAASKSRRQFGAAGASASVSSCGGTLWYSTSRPFVSRITSCIPETRSGGSVDDTDADGRSVTSGRGLVRYQKSSAGGVPDPSDRHQSACPCCCIHRGGSGASVNPRARSITGAR